MEANDNSNQDGENIGGRTSDGLQIAVSFGTNEVANLPKVSPHFSQNPPSSHTSFDNQGRPANFQTLDVISEMPLLSQ